MLEISSLDVSQEKLPCKEANLNSICIQEMTLLNRSHKPDIDYRIDLPVPPIILPAPEIYLSLVIEHLLSAAN